MSRQRLAILLLLVGCGGAIGAWNIARFAVAEPTIRVDRSLEFLPDPRLAHALAMGHQATVANLMWIDSTAYFQHQLDARDDTVPGGTRGGFDRLYDTLIHLDPRFRPYYFHAATSIGAVIGDFATALGFVERGLLHHPHDSDLWRNAAAILVAHFDMEERHPAILEALLERWAAAEEEAGRAAEYGPKIWLEAMARRQQRGLAQAAYWAEQYRSAGADRVQRRLAEAVLREQLAAYGTARLQQVVDAHVARHGAPPDALVAALRPENLAAVYPTTEAVGGPAEPLVVVPVDERTVRFGLRLDPYGLPWRLDGAVVVSTGGERAVYRRWLETYNRMLAVQARARGRWPRSVAELDDFIAPHIPVPPGGRSVLRDGLLDVVFPDEEDAEPWTIEQLLQAAAVDPSAPPGG